MLLNILLTVMAPVFLVIVAGMIAARFTSVDVRSLNRLALYTAVPALTLQSLAEANLAFGEVARLVVAFLLFLVAMTVLARLLGWWIPESGRRGLIATSVFGNAANMMLPVSLFAYGELGMQRALILYIVSSLLMFTVGPLVLGSNADLKKSLRSLAGFPVLWACVAGVLIGASGWTMPAGLERGVSLLADAAVPLVLLTLGVQIGRVTALKPTRVNWFGTGVKLLLAPVVAYGIGVLLGLTGVDLAILTLLAAMPPAVNNFMLALEFGGNAEQVGRTVILATGCALVSLPIVVTLVRI